MTIDEAYSFFCRIETKISAILKRACEISLGHLLIGQQTSTLSGGENIRIKLLKSLNTSSNVYGIDEPFRGLAKEEIFNIIRFLNKLAIDGHTIIVADHEEDCVIFFDNKILLTNKSNKLIGIEYNP